MLWVDKYRPVNLKQLDYHPELTDRLMHLAETTELPHLMVYGPSGAGKKTRVMALLVSIFGKNVTKLRLEHKTFQPEGTSKKIEITTVASNYHIEINPSDAGFNDRFVVQEVIKEIAQYRLADANAKREFKVVVLTEVDQLSKQAQHALRRTMEKYTSSCRLILMCNSPSKVIDPIQSRCVGIRVGAPTHEEICHILQGICAKQDDRFEPALAMEIAKKSERNLRRAILMLEAARVHHYPFAPNQQVQRPEWEDYLCQLAKEILQDQSPAGLLKARDKLYELLANCIPPEVIFKVLCRELMTRVDDEMKHKLIEAAAFYEHRIHCGSKDIFHIEAFIAKFMTLYKAFLLDFYM